MNNNRIRRVVALRLFYVIGSACCIFTMLADERIVSWRSDIIVRADATMRVAEQLTVNVEGKQIKRGIMREFPTRYTTALGFHYNVLFSMVSASLDGRPVDYKMVQHANGVRVYLGSPDAHVPLGTHVYTITYETDRQIGFFDHHDELYWNVTGVGWPWYIDHVYVHVTLPEGIKEDTVQAEGYTGFWAAKGRDYRVHSTNNTIEWQTTRPLAPHEGLTIVATFPKGFVQQSSMVWSFLRDNIGFVLLLLILLMAIIAYSAVYCFTRKAIKHGTIIPLFYPPHGMDPGAMRYMVRMSYDSNALAAYIVHLAVRGFLLIEHLPATWLSRGSYQLKKRTDCTAQCSGLEGRMMHILFSQSDTCRLTQEYHAVFEQARQVLKKEYELLYAIDHLQSHAEYVGIIGTTCLVASVLVFMMFPGELSQLWTWVVVIAQALVHSVMYGILPMYTQRGQKLKEEIEGFTLFLTTTETERLALIGTPPTKTPELFERYLPYAIALGVEKQWSEQFVPIFKHLEQTDHAYRLQWYHAGHPFSALDLALLSSSLGSSLNSAIKSASAPISSGSRPGSSSGSGGSGYSGGGGGGGGGGGW